MSYICLKKKNKAYQIFVDDEYIGFIYSSDFPDIGLNARDFDDDYDIYELETEEDIVSKFKNIITDRTFEKAVALATTSECCREDIFFKLKRKDYPEYAIEAAIDMMYEYNYLNDKRYAECYIRSYMKTKSKKAIEKELEMKKLYIPALGEFIDRVYEDEGMSEEKTIEKLLQSKYRGQDMSDPKVKKRAMGLLIRHGFSFDQINNYLT